MKMTQAVLLLALVGASCAWCAQATEDQAKKASPDQFDPKQCFDGCMEFCIGVLQLPDTMCRTTCNQLCYHSVASALQQLLKTLTSAQVSSHIGKPNW